MSMDYSLKAAKEDLNSHLNGIEKISPNSARSWLYLLDVDVPTVSEAERLNIVLTVILWEVQHGCVSEPMSDELYLYYEQLTKGELDSIDAEEREEVVRDLTDCFNKVFPEGLEKNG